MARRLSLRAFDSPPEAKEMTSRSRGRVMATYRSRLRSCASLSRRFASRKTPDRLDTSPMRRPVSPVAQSRRTSVSGDRLAPVPPRASTSTTMGNSSPLARWMLMILTASRVSSSSGLSGSFSRSRTRRSSSATTSFRVPLPSALVSSATRRIFSRLATACWPAPELAARTDRGSSLKIRSTARPASRKRASRCRPWSRR